MLPTKPLKNQNMNQSKFLALAVAGTASLLAAALPNVTAAPAEQTPPVGASERTYGIDQRVPWTTSRIVGSPDAPSPYAIKRVFPKLKFTNPVDVVSAPGTDRLFIAELGGKIYSIPNRQDCETPELFLDTTNAVKGAEQVYGLTFHPNFETNHYAYICYVLKSDLPEGSRVSRFTVNESNPPRVDPASEVILITWLSGGHNGGCLKFGPDGYLYISTGDGAGPNPPDPLQTGQDNSDLLSSILRIDVDHADNGKRYRVPPDNPFVKLSGVRPEIWAYGFRNPWRMSFDRKTGDLWAGDVGWELWELVYRVERGGNYGWSVVEGPQSVHPEWKRGPTPILPPVKAHPHSEAASVTGGYVYHGQKLKDLVGAYIYGDWVSGKIWALRNDGNKLASLQELVDTPLQIICFGEDHAGELYVFDYAGGLYQLEPNTATSTHLTFPRKLSETGLFDSVRNHIPAPGVIPFLINAEAWSDHSLAERFVALPEKSTIQTGATNVWLYQSKNEWRYPTNAVLGKTLYLEMKRGRNPDVRRVETQILHYDGLDWHAYSYRWNDEQTDANLVDAAGEDRTFEIKDSSVPGGRRHQNWRFHGRTECLRCHNPWGNFALAFTAPQLNREVQYQADHPICGSLPVQMKPSPWLNEAVRRDNQLRTFSHLGFFDQPLDERARPKFTDPYATEPGTDLTERARSWLHVNCAHCHREGAGGAVVSHFDYDTKLAEMKAIGRAPSQGTLGLTGAHVITPGDPFSSVLYYRIMTTGQGRMPHIGSRAVDVAGAKLMHDWIRQLPKEFSEDKHENPAAAKLQEESSDALERVWGSRWTTEQRSAAIDRLLSSPNGALYLAGALSQRGGDSLPGTLRDRPISFEEKVANHLAFQVRDLFERFLPEEKRAQKLGAVVKADEILARPGEAPKGRQIFFQEGVQCARCHRINGEGTDFGPDLSHIAQKYARSQILENILFPSKTIEPNFISYQVETKDELSYSGFILKRTSDEIVLKDPNAKEVHLRSQDVKTVQAQSISVMPELLLQSLTVQNVADLLEYLSSLH